MSEGQSPDTSTTDEAQRDPQVVEARRSPWKSGPCAGLLFGLLGGLLAWLIIEAGHPLFALSEEVVTTQMTVPDELQRPVDRNNTMAALAILGGAAAAALAVGEGLCRKSWLASLVGGAACTLVGAAFGCLAGYVGFIGLEHYEPRPDLSDLVKTLRVQGAMLGALGGGVGLGLGIFLARRLAAVIQCLVAGLLAGALAGIAYPMLAAVFLPGVITEVVVPICAKERLLWIAIFTGLVGVTIPGIARKPDPKPPEE